MKNYQDPYELLQQHYGTDFTVTPAVIDTNQIEMQQGATASYNFGVTDAAALEVTKQFDPEAYDRYSNGETDARDKFGVSVQARYNNNRLIAAGFKGYDLPQAEEPPFDPANFDFSAFYTPTEYTGRHTTTGDALIQGALDTNMFTAALANPYSRENIKQSFIDAYNGLGLPGLESYMTRKNTDPNFEIYKWVQDQGLEQYAEHFSYDMNLAAATQKAALIKDAETYKAQIFAENGGAYLFGGLLGAASDPTNWIAPHMKAPLLARALTGAAIGAGVAGAQEVVFRTADPTRTNMESAMNIAFSSLMLGGLTAVKKGGIIDVGQIDESLTPVKINQASTALSTGTISHAPIDPTPCRM